MLESDLLMHYCQQNIAIKEWTSHVGSDSSREPEYINIVTDTMYAIPKAGMARLIQMPVRKKHALAQCSDVTKASASSKSAPSAVETVRKSDQIKTQ